MIGRSGSSAVSWVAASQSLRIGKWRLGADVCIGCLAKASEASLQRCGIECHAFDAESDPRRRERGVLAIAAAAPTRGSLPIASAIKPTRYYTTRGVLHSP